MTQEDKKLLLADLCARLPYGVKYQVTRPVFPTMELRTSNERLRRCEITVNGNYGVGCNSATLMSITKIKSYLRPMSSMTEEEKHNYFMTYTSIKSIAVPHPYKTQDWLNAHHFDYRGLIPMSLAIGVTKENNPYET